MKLPRSFSSSTMQLRTNQAIDLRSLLVIMESSYPSQCMTGLPFMASITNAPPPIHLPIMDVPSACITPFSEKLEQCTYYAIPQRHSGTNSAPPPPISPT